MKIEIEKLSENKYKWTLYSDDYRIIKIGMEKSKTAALDRASLVMNLLGGHLI